jgi:CBS-domain-containing membrane protein
MNSAIERLLALRVEDVMNREVVTVSESETMKQAAKRLANFEVTGAPVVDDSGRCVGVLSGSDFVGKDAGLHPSETMLVKNTLHEPFHVERLENDRVDAHMSPVVQTISPKAGVIQAARMLCGEHIHRLMVLDDDQRPVGVLSSLDLLAAMIAAVEE